MVTVRSVTVLVIVGLVLGGCGRGSDRYPGAYLQAIHQTYLTTSTHAEDRSFLRFGNHVCNLYDRGGTAGAVQAISSIASGRRDTRTIGLLRATDVLCPVHRGDSSVVIAYLEARHR